MQSVGALKRGWQTPIDEIDAASRILDLIFVGEEGEGEEKRSEESKEEKKNEEEGEGRGRHDKEGAFRPFGKFYKDYHETEW
tara:strand:+ start:2259 stop:2504 length:246 start_codon:yes stop_codon:yes gene_type:complete